MQLNFHLFVLSINPLRPSSNIQDLSMAVPKTIETKCNDSSVQALKHTRTTQVTPSLYRFVCDVLQQAML